MSGTVLLSGATGFLGMEVLVRLLGRTDRDVLCIVRADDASSAHDRIDAVFGALFGAHERTRDRARVRVLEGDLVGTLPVPDEPIDVVCHCAASIAFDLPLARARAINVEGTRTMLDRARQVGAKRFVHVSTAYVAGTHSGVFAEGERGVEFRNTYEQTKCEAESLFDAVADLEVAIARPSIVMGESDSGWTPVFNVLYWPLRAFARGLFPETVPALPDGRVDAVPVDYVADGILRLIDSDLIGTFNLVSGASAVTVEQLGELACAHFDRPAPIYAPAPVDAGAGDLSDRPGGVYLPYFDMAVEFDDRNTRERLELSVPPLPTYFNRLLDYADFARWGKNGVTRAAARARVRSGDRARPQQSVQKSWSGRYA